MHNAAMLWSHQYLLPCNAVGSSGAVRRAVLATQREALEPDAIMTQKAICIRIVLYLNLAYGGVLVHLPSADCKRMTSRAPLQMLQRQQTGPT